MIFEQRVSFKPKKFAKGVTFRLSRSIKASNFCKFIIFVDQIIQILRNLFNNAKIYS